MEKRRRQSNRSSRVIGGEVVTLDFEDGVKADLTNYGASVPHWPESVSVPNSNPALREAIEADKAGKTKSEQNEAGRDEDQVAEEIPRNSQRGPIAATDERSGRVSSFQPWGERISVNSVESRSSQLSYVTARTSLLSYVSALSSRYILVLFCCSLEPKSVNRQRLYYKYCGSPQVTMEDASRRQESHPQPV
jgi:hypothetical protein